MSSKVAALLSALALAFTALPANAQSDIQWDRPGDRPAQAYDPYRPVPEARYFSPREVESLVAPIALFPDNLVAQILMAATYPYDIEDAASWVSDPRNARLVGYALTDALDDMDWDPSVKVLTSAPDILRMMDDRRDWTARLGQAFTADQGMVMDAVQNLRQQARAAGRLYSDRYRRIVYRGGEIIIEPVSPSEMYVEFYDPTVAFGVWAYPDYPPYYFPRVYYDVVRPIPIITPLWGWSTWDWGAHRLRLDVGRWQRLNHNRPPVITGNIWRHDPGRNQGREFRGGMNRTNYGRPGFSPGYNGGFNGRVDRDGNRDGNRDPNRDTSRDGRWNRDRTPSAPNAPPQANANPSFPNPSFHGRGPGLNQPGQYQNATPQRDDRNRDNRDNDRRERWNRGRQDANLNPVAPAAPVTPNVTQPAPENRGFNRFNRDDRREDRPDRRGDGGWRQREANVNPNVAPAAPQAVPQPEQNRFGRGDRGEGRGWQRRQETNVSPPPQPAPPAAEQRAFEQRGFEQRQGRGEGQANAGNFGRGRFGGQPNPPAAAPQPQPPQPQAQPNNNNGNNGEQQRRFHGRGRGDDPAR